MPSSFRQEYAVRLSYNKSIMIIVSSGFLLLTTLNFDNGSQLVQSSRILLVNSIFLTLITILSSLFQFQITNVNPPDRCYFISSFFSLTLCVFGYFCIIKHLLDTFQGSPLVYLILFSIVILIQYLISYIIYTLNKSRQV
jgi:hypothetical protein